jgi:hypothetical protein
MRLHACLLIVTLANWSCGGSLTGPDTPQPSPAPEDVATISGQVYDNVTGADRAIPNALVEVNQADGSSVTATTNSSGVYRISVRRGAITITASSDGYESTQWQFDLANDTVLNFGLTPR